MEGSIKEDEKLDPICSTDDIVRIQHFCFVERAVRDPMQRLRRVGGRLDEYWRRYAGVSKFKDSSVDFSSNGSRLSGTKQEGRNRNAREVEETLTSSSAALHLNANRLSMGCRWELRSWSRRISQGALPARLCVRLP